MLGGHAAERPKGRARRRDREPAMGTHCKGAKGTRYGTCHGRATGGAWGRAPRRARGTRHGTRHGTCQGT
eukprot:1272771-Pyramimonas_sp.AAC.1